MSNNTLLVPALDTNYKRFMDALLEKINTNEEPPKAGLEFKLALNSHPLWGQFPLALRPSSSEQIHDISLLRRAQAWKARTENHPTVVSDDHPTSVFDLPPHKRPREWRTGEIGGISCDTCRDLGCIANGRSAQNQRLWRLCPDCEAPKRAKAKAKAETAALNARWGLSDGLKRLAEMKWYNNRDGGHSTKAARQAQQQIISEMPSVKTLLLFGMPGVGKTRLLTEIVTVARAQGLSAIIRSIEHIRRIIQNYPESNDSPAEKARKQKRLKIAREDLRKTHVLCVDELDDARGPAIMSELLDIVNHRLENGLTTCFAANPKGSGLDFLTPPLYDRLIIARGNLVIDMRRDSSMRGLVGV